MRDDDDVRCCCGGGNSDDLRRRGPDKRVACRNQIVTVFQASIEACVFREVRVGKAAAFHAFLPVRWVKHFCARALLQHSSRIPGARDGRNSRKITFEEDVPVRESSSRLCSCQTKINARRGHHYRGRRARRRRRLPRALIRIFGAQHARFDTDRGAKITAVFHRNFHSEDWKESTAREYRNKI